MIMLFSILTVLAVSSCTAQNVSLEVVGLQNVDVLRLENEECAPRPTLVPVGGLDDHYYPLIITLHQCGGACGTDQRTKRQCASTSSTPIHVHVYNKLTASNETLVFANHTSCGCSCVHNNTVCAPTQVWDQKTCKCGCANQDPNITESCGNNYQWNPLFCMCECDLTCPDSKKTYLNETSCSCACKERVYQKCSRRKKVVREEDCTCVPVKESKFPLLCSDLPPKWAAIIIVISFFAFVVLVVDCVLYCKSTGCLHASTHMCLKDRRSIKNNKTFDSEEVIDKVQLKTTETT